MSRTSDLVEALKVFSFQQRENGLRFIVGKSYRIIKEGTQDYLKSKPGYRIGDIFVVAEVSPNIVPGSCARGTDGIWRLNYEVEEVKCNNCNGRGYTAEQDPNATREDAESIQVQCNCSLYI